MKELAPHQYQAETADEVVTITFALENTTLSPVISRVPSGATVPVTQNQATVKIDRFTILQVVYQFNGAADGDIVTTVSGAAGGSFEDEVIQPGGTNKAIRALYTFTPK
jgi:hypothetical protein